MPSYVGVGVGGTFLFLNMASVSVSVSVCSVAFFSRLNEGLTDVPACIMLLDGGMAADLKANGYLCVWVGVHVCVDESVRSFFPQRWLCCAAMTNWSESESAAGAICLSLGACGWLAGCAHDNDFKDTWRFNSGGWTHTHTTTDTLDLANLMDGHIARAVSVPVFGTDRFPFTIATWLS